MNDDKQRSSNNLKLTTWRSLSYKVRELGHHVAVFGLYGAFRYRLRRMSGLERIPVRMPGIPTPILCRRNDSDTRVLDEIFRRGYCEVSLDNPPKLIIDGGANAGYASVFYATAFPEARILAVEPNDENYEMILANCAAYPNVEVIQGAIWPTETPVHIANPDSESWGFRVEESKGNPDQSVPGITIPRLLEMAGADTIDFLKLDIEGAEEALFNHDDLSWLDRVRVVAIETHGPDSESAVRNALRNRPFEESLQGDKLMYTRHAK
jgi:FkbM family methyltransferase